MALEQMEGFELAGRTVRHPYFDFVSPIYHFHPLQLRVNTVHEKGTAKYTQADTLDEAGGGLHSLSVVVSGWLTSTSGGNLNAASRQALMQKLARIEPAPVQPQPM
jgi:RNA-binding protein 23/39